mmetsp:Transcript_16576/g.41380  ORF Transcript_16576/g.41380 Transcript_16576/m.41380 type:complete len:246 (+) Transcript_16576:251-988(+)
MTSSQWSFCSCKHIAPHMSLISMLPSAHSCRSSCASPCLEPTTSQQQPTLPRLHTCCLTAMDAPSHTLTVPVSFQSCTLASKSRLSERSTSEIGWFLLLATLSFICCSSCILNFSLAESLADRLACSRSSSAAARCSTTAAFASSALLTASFASSRSFICSSSRRCMASAVSCARCLRALSSASSFASFSRQCFSMTAGSTQRLYSGSLPLAAYSAVLACRTMLRVNRSLRSRSCLSSTASHASL